MKYTRRGEQHAHLLAVLTTMPTECTTWPYRRSRGTPRSDGYALITEPGRKSIYVHTLVCEWYHGPRPAGMQVRHLCGNGRHGCFTPSHLRWGTAAENVADTRAHGRLGGEHHPKAKLTWALVDAIRARHAAGETQASLAREHDVQPSVIWHIVHNRTWRKS